MNLYDILTGIVVVGALIVGLWQGLIRTIVIAVIAYACVLLAGLYFQRIGDSIHLIANYNLVESLIMAFIVVFLLSASVLISMGSYTFRFVQPAIFGGTGRILAVMVSLLTWLAVWSLFASLLLQLQFVAIEPDMPTFFLSQTNLTTISESRSLPVLRQSLTPTVIALIDPFVFSDIYDIFPNTETIQP